MPQQQQHTFMYNVRYSGTVVYKVCCVNAIHRYPAICYSSSEYQTFYFYEEGGKKIALSLDSHVYTECRRRR